MPSISNALALARATLHSKHSSYHRVQWLCITTTELKLMPLNIYYVLFILFGYVSHVIIIYTSSHHRIYVILLYKTTKYNSYVPKLISHVAWLIHQTLFFFFCIENHNHPYRKKSNHLMILSPFQLLFERLQFFNIQNNFFPT